MRSVEHQRGTLHFYEYKLGRSKKISKQIFFSFLCKYDSVDTKLVAYGSLQLMLIKVQCPPLVFNSGTRQHYFFERELIQAITTDKYSQYSLNDLRKGHSEVVDKSRWIASARQWVSTQGNDISPWKAIDFVVPTKTYFESYTTPLDSILEEWLQVG